MYPPVYDANQVFVVNYKTTQTKGRMENGNGDENHD